MVVKKRAVGIVCEYNPFHNGHKFQIDSVRKAYPDHDICMVMSGNFVQRASPAIADKYTRAKAAVFCGADLVLELPFPYSTFSAEQYAQSALSILMSLPVVDVIAFGAEEPDEALLRGCAEVLLSDSFASRFKEALEKNPEWAYASVREEVLAWILPEAKGLLKRPNNILAIEYEKALLLAKSEIIPFVIRRDGLTSATAIRAALKNGSGIAQDVPSSALAIYEEAKSQGRFPADIAFFERLMLAAIRAGLECPELSSLGARLYQRALKAMDYDEFIGCAKTRKITEARVRRGVLHGYFNVPEKLSPVVPYTLVLAFNERGRELLANLRRVEILPLYTKPAYALREAAEAKIRAAALLSAKADSIYADCIRVHGNYFLKQVPEIVNKL